MSIDLGIVVVVLHRFEIFAVFDDDPGLLSSALVMNHMEVVPLIFAAPQVQKRTRDTAQASTDTLGL